MDPSDNELIGFVCGVMGKPCMGLALTDDAAMLMFPEGKTLYIRIHDGELAYDFDWPS